MKLEKVNKLEFNKETKKLDKKVEMLKITPEEGKCFINKNTKHKFINSETKEGLPLTIGVNELSLYDEIEIGDVK